MSTHSPVDDILRSLSHLPTPTQPCSTQSNANPPSTRYTTDQYSSSKATNPLSTLAPSASQDAKSLFLTLHLLFPHELLPALDLLDRGLVTRLVHPSNALTKDPTSTTTVPDTNTIISANPAENDVFCIQSASATTSQHHPKHSLTTPGEPQGRFHNALVSTSKGKGSATRTYYEVRLDSWNCSCAAFAFSSLTCLNKADEDEHEGDAHSDNGINPGEQGDYAGEADNSSQDASDWRFGGTLTFPNVMAGVPVCKHILAAVTVRAAPGLFVEGEHYSVRRDVGREEMAGWAAGWGD